MTIQNHSLTLQQFQPAIELGRWKDILLTKGVIEIIFYVQISQIWQRYEDDSNSTPSFDITYLIFYKALDIVKIGVGRYCFIRTKGNARAWT